MTIACKDSFDWPVSPRRPRLPRSTSSKTRTPPSARACPATPHGFAAAYGDQMIGNMMTEGIVPSLLHEDPRYFRLGEGSGWSRARYALTRIFVVRTDSDATRSTSRSGAAMPPPWPSPTPGIPTPARSPTTRKSCSSSAPPTPFPRCSRILARRQAAFQEETRRRRTASTASTPRARHARPAALSRRRLRLFQHANIVQISVLLVEIQAVSTTNWSGIWNPT